ncbi:MAG: sugar ABC transporter ATP-binding protein [Spirochaetia bacterium]|jgi:ribose transport system ATP-binding protein
MENQDLVLQLSGISKGFPGVKALDGVSLDFRRGEVHGLVGENGAGKSTLMKILSGVFPADAGEVLLNGAPVSFRTPHEAQMAGISIIFQEFSLIRGFDVTDNVFLNREPVHFLGHLDKRAARERTRALLEEIGIELDVDRRVEDLSVVQQQVVEIVKALSVTASVLIMDEPSAALTDKELQKLFQIIRTLTARGVTVIYISHMLDEVFEIADRVTVLKDGRVVATRPAKDLTKDELVRLMVGRTIEDYFPGLGAAPGRTLLEVHGLQKKGRLFDIVFDLHAGEILGLAGMVGSGRNLLARCILGLEQFDGGEIRFGGRGRPPRNFHDAMSAGFGYITDDRKSLGILGPMSIRDNVTIASLPSYLAFGFLRRRREAEDAGRQVQRFSIKSTGIGQSVETLSGGNQQKVLLSRWLLREPDVLVISEPTRGVDVGAKAEIYRIMREVTATGKAILMISSELTEVIGISDRIMVMRSGRIEGVIDQHQGRATEEQIMSLAVGHAYTIRQGEKK